MPMTSHLFPRRRLCAAALAAVLAGPARAAAPALGSGAPDFTLPVAGGGNLRLAEQRGRVVLVNFWASWCGPCKVELPQLDRLYEKYRASGFVLLGVNIDDNPRAAADLAARLGMRFPVLLDSERKVSRLYDVSAMPSTLLIDRDGRLRHLHRGYRSGYENLYDQQIRALLKE